MILTRQGIPVIDQEKYAKAGELEKGAYILSDRKKPAIILIGTGSEVPLILAAQAKTKRTKHCSTSGKYAIMGIV